MLTHYINSYTENNKKIIDLFKIAIKNVLYLYYLYEVNYLNKHTNTLIAMFINYVIDLYSCDKIYVLHHIAVMSMVINCYIYDFNSNEQFIICKTMINCEFSTVFLNNYFMLSYIKKNDVTIINKNITELFISRYYDKVVLFHKWIIVILFLKLRAYDFFTKIILNSHLYYIGFTYPLFNSGILGVYIIYGLHLFWTYEVIAKFGFGRVKNKQQPNKQNQNKLLKEKIQ